MNPADKARTVLAEFKNFAFKGNVVDLAIGVIIGAAFGKIVDSLVKSILMPAISILLPGQGGYLSWKLTVGGQEIPYGLFLGEVVNFLIVALALYVFIVKFLGWLTRAKREAAAVAAPPGAEPGGDTVDRDPRPAPGKRGQRPSEPRQQPHVLKRSRAHEN